MTCFIMQVLAFSHNLFICIFGILLANNTGKLCHVVLFVLYAYENIFRIFSGAATVHKLTFFFTQLIKLVFVFVCSIL